MSDMSDDYEPEPEQVSIIDLLDRLEALVNQSRRVPLTPNIVVNEEEILDALDQIRVGMPEEIKESRMVLETRESRLREAQEQAEQIVLAAQERAERLTDEHELTRRANAEADEILTDARERSRKMRRDADDYARERMEELETQLSSALNQVRRGLETLEAGREGAGEEKPKGRGRRR
ncbi:MAG: ATPase [Candidatus Dormibacteraeota bacterium]|jgi:F0F1-type ATP synthase membrane subunit b/b'|nr:ATPase [Candidatus Dormibacteraeota bacterium]